ncbi:MAG TPA: DoxX family membrane protein [Longimicrobium sp.]
MAPLIVQLVAWAAFWLAGLAGLLPSASTPAAALRFALAVMFCFTALSHFLPRTRPDLIRMVPPVLPAPGLLVSLTGVLELAGAIGLLLPPLTRLAALALAALLVALFPANIHAARAGLPVAGRPAMPLRFRLPLQVFWIACLLWVAAMLPPAGVLHVSAT